MSVDEVEYESLFSKDGREGLSGFIVDDDPDNGEAGSGRPLEICG